METIKRFTEGAFFWLVVMPFYLVAIGIGNALILGLLYCAITGGLPRG